MQKSLDIVEVYFADAVFEVLLSHLHIRTPFGHINCPCILRYIPLKLKLVRSRVLHHQLHYFIYQGHCAFVVIQLDFRYAVLELLFDHNHVQKVLLGATAASLNRINHY